MERVTTLKANYLSDCLGHEVFIVTTEQMGRPVFYSLSGKVTLCNLDIGIYERFGKESYVRKVISRHFKTIRYRRQLKKLLYEIRPDITVSTLGLDIGFINSLDDGSVKIGELHFPGNFRTLMAGKLSDSLIPNLVARLRTCELKHKCGSLERLVVLTREEKSFWHRDNVEVIPNPLTFHPQSCAHLESCKALAVGRLAYEKGFDILVDIWQKVTVTHPAWELHIYGSGNQKEALLRQITDSGMSDNIILHEPVTDIENVYPACSIFLFPSRYLEALPMVMLEAMSFGLPVVSFDAPCGPKDLIDDGNNGFLVPAGDTDMFADCVCRLIESQVLRNSFGRAAKISSMEYNMESIMEKWKNLFRELVDKS
jgi:glycosyltransferase involved in cell wall biosynthesis